MVIVDTTVWVDFLLAQATRQVVALESFLQEGEDICICGLILTEVLQGIRNESEYQRTKARFDNLIFLPMTYATFVKSAELYRSLRGQGITIRKSVDCLIATVAIEHDIPLLHNDKDFDPLEEHCGLKTVKLR